MKCPNCGKEVENNARFCGSCGKPVPPPAPQRTPPPQYAPPPVPPPQYAPPAPQYAPPTPQPTAVAGGISPKSKSTVTMLAFFLGSMGVHRFYVGKTGTGIVQLLLLVIGAATISIVVGYPVLVVLSIWWWVDFFTILRGKFKDKNGLLIK